jgi:hypothetical protein
MPVSLPDPSDIDAWLEVVSDADRAGAAIRSESCPEKAMERALQLFPDLDSQIIYNPATPSYPEMLETLASDKDVTVRTAVKANPRTPKEVKAMMALLKD